MIDRPPTVNERQLLLAIVAGRVLEVRCCCTPQKLVGWILLPDSVRLAENVRVSFLLQPDQYAMAVPGVAPADVLRENLESVNCVELEIRRLGVPDGELGFRQRLALRAEHIPIEVLRRVRSFVEYVPGLDDVQVELGPAA